MKISIISPVYKAEKIVDELVKRIDTEVSKITDDYEIILVEDGSLDNSWTKIEANCAANKKIKGIKLSRNFGQHYAISAGFEFCTGDVAILMDCDLQDDPKYFAEFLNEHKKGYDVVFSKKKFRKHSYIKNITAQAFNSIFNYLVDNNSWKASSDVGSYSLLSRKAINSFNRVQDYRRHYLMIVRWLGYNFSFIDIEHKERFEGKSSYNFSKLLNHAIDGITSQSDKILKLTVYLGFFLSSISFLAALIIVIQSFFSSFQAGWASLSVLILFVGGMIITSIGITGIYIGKIFEQTKNRPLFLVDKKINL